MATMKDLEELKSLMQKAFDEPHLFWFGNIALAYSHTSECWMMRFDSDLTINFDKAEYFSNNIILYRHDAAIAWFCHTHQKGGTHE